MITAPAAATYPLVRRIGINLHSSNVPGYEVIKMGSHKYDFPFPNYWRSGSRSPRYARHRDSRCSLCGAGETSRLRSKIISIHIYLCQKANILKMMIEHYWTKLDNI